MFPLPSEEQADEGTHVGRTHLEMVILPRMHMDRKSRAIHQGFQEVSDHRKGFFARPALGHGVQYGELSQPKLAIFVDSTSESHTHLSLRARWRIARASLSLISVWRGMASCHCPSVQTSCRPPWRRNRQPSCRSAASNSCFFMPSVYTDACTMSKVGFLKAQ